MKKPKWYTIGVVAKTYEIHQQTLRLYEREGLLTPSRSQGNTRLYSDSDLVRLETILALTRDLGVNLAGVAVILDLLDRIEELQSNFERFVTALREHMDSIAPPPAATSALALVPRRRPIEHVRPASGWSEV
jgi:MerR family transcriptional regulator/heat shock protein HspR